MSERGDEIESDELDDDLEFDAQADEHEDGEDGYWYRGRWTTLPPEYFTDDRDD